MDTKLDHRLSGLLALVEDTTESWSVDDLRQMVRHQMQSPLVVDLSDGDGNNRADRPPIDSFEDLFTAESPPLDLLLLTKRFAKSSLLSDGGTPREIAHLLYYLSIATARTRLGESISTLDPDTLIEGLTWCLDQPWVDPPIRDQLGACLALL